MLSINMTLLSQFLHRKGATGYKAYADGNSLSIFLSKYLLSSRWELLLRWIFVFWTTCYKCNLWMILKTNCKEQSWTQQCWSLNLFLLHFWNCLFLQIFDVILNVCPIVRHYHSQYICRITYVPSPFKWQ